MKLAIIILPLALVAAVTVIRQAQAAAGAMPLAHVRNSFEFDVRAPLKNTFPLFGAHQERGWAGEQWNPEFVYPQPERDVAGMVFTVARHGHQSTWVNTAFDAATGHAQYVYVVPGMMATLIDIHLLQRGSQQTHVTVVYERTALSDDANNHVRKLGAEDRGSAAHWEQAINGYLDKQRR